MTKMIEIAFKAPEERRKGVSGQIRLCGLGTSLIVRWLRLCASNAEGWGSISAQGSRSHMPQLRVHRLQLQISHVTTKMEDPLCLNMTQCSQIDKYILIFLKKTVQAGIRILHLFNWRRVEPYSLILHRHPRALGLFLFCFWCLI